MSLNPYSQPSLDRSQGKEAQGRVLYLLGGLITACGIGVFAWFLYSGIMGLDDSLQQVVIPEVVRMDLEPGLYTVFYEYKSDAAGADNFGSRGVSGLVCKVAEASTGEGVPVSRARFNSNYSLGSRAGYSIYEFKIKSAGEYDFSCDFKEDGDFPVVVAVGKGFMKDLLFTIFGSLAILFLGMGGGITVIVVTAVKRSRAAKGNW